MRDCKSLMQIIIAGLVDGHDEACEKQF